jgi:hypothetical protein
MGLRDSAAKGVFVASTSRKGTPSGSDCCPDLVPPPHLDPLDAKPPDGFSRRVEPATFQCGQDGVVSVNWVRLGRKAVRVKWLRACRTTVELGPLFLDVLVGCSIATSMLICM